MRKFHKNAEIFNLTLLSLLAGTSRRMQMSTTATARVIASLRQAKNITQSLNIEI